MQEGCLPASVALKRRPSRPEVKDVQSSSVADCILFTEVDSTVELPAKPDPGSAGSSSCVSITQST